MGWGQGQTPLQTDTSGPRWQLLGDARVLVQGHTGPAGPGGKPEGQSVTPRPV